MKNQNFTTTFSVEQTPPQIEWYGNCLNAWAVLVKGNLRNLIIMGKNQPDAFA